MEPSPVAAQTSPANAGDMANVVPERPTVRSMVRETWEYRRLVPRLGIRVTIKGISGTILGRIWLVLRPALQIFAMAFLFGGILNAPSEGLPYVVFMLVGMHAWITFERAAFWAVRSFDTYARIIRNLYMPLLLVPISAGIPALVEWCVIGSFAALTILYFALVEGDFYVQLSGDLLLVPVGYLLAYLTALSTGLWVGTLNAYARDVRIVFIFALQIWIYVTPVIYPITALDGGFRVLAELNPVTSSVLLVKQGVLGVGTVPAHSLLVTALYILIVGASGLWFLASRTPSLRSRGLALMDEEEE